MENFKEITRNTYDTQAVKIAARFAEFFPTYRKPVVDKFLSYLNVGKEFRALDIGCGSGDAATYIKEVFSKGSGPGSEVVVIGIDLSTGMLNAAKKKGW